VQCHFLTEEAEFGPDRLLFSERTPTSGTLEISRIEQIFRTAATEVPGGVANLNGDSLRFKEPTLAD